MNPLEFRGKTVDEENNRSETTDQKVRRRSNRK